MPTLRLLTVVALIVAQIPAIAPARAAAHSSAAAQLTDSTPAALCDSAATERLRLSESQGVRISSQPFAGASVFVSGALGVRFGRQPAGAVCDAVGTRFLVAPSVRARCCVLLI